MGNRMESENCSVLVKPEFIVRKLVHLFASKIFEIPIIKLSTLYKHVKSVLTYRCISDIVG